MSSIMNLGMNSSTTKDWLNATRDMKLTAYAPCSRQLQIVLVRHPETPVERLPLRETNQEIGEEEVV